MTWWAAWRRHLALVADPGAVEEYLREGHRPIILGGDPALVDFIENAPLDEMQRGLIAGIVEEQEDRRWR